MTGQKTPGVFGDFDPDEYAAEARERWGGTEAYARAARRTAGYGEEQWQELGREANEIYAALARLMEAGASAGDPEAMDLAEQHRQHISRWFYDCTPEIHAALGEMYVADPRFTENLERHGPGLARFLADAIAADTNR